MRIRENHRRITRARSQDPVKFTGEFDGDAFPGKCIFGIPGNGSGERQAAGSPTPYWGMARFRHPFPLNLPAMGPEIPDTGAVPEYTAAIMSPRDSGGIADKDFSILAHF